MEYSAVQSTYWSVYMCTSQKPVNVTHAICFYSAVSLRRTVCGHGSIESQ